jgi:hypothetical protein
MQAVYAEWLAALEQSGLGHLARHSPWLYTASNVLHVIGAALLVGAIAVFDTALVARRWRDASAIGRIAIPLAATGLAVQIPTGVVLLAAEARALGQNPAFYAKLVLIAVGLTNVALFHARFGRSLQAGAVAAGARGLAFASMTAWVLALVAGRMIAYL